MATKDRRSVTPRDIARVMFRHRRKIILVFTGVTTLTLLALAFFPRSYASESKLLIRVGRETVSLDPTATTGETIMLQKTQEDEVNSALNILGSRRVLEQVVERVGPERIINDTALNAQAMPGAASTFRAIGAWVSSTLRTLRLSDPGTPLDQAVRRLERKCRLTAPKQSMVITVRYTAASPQLAHDVVAAITDVFLEEHSRLSQTDGSLAFFAEQAEKLHTQLTAAQSQLRDRKNTYQRTSSDSRLSILENARDAMREKIYDLQLHESELRSRYTDEYPPLRELKRQREEAERLLTDLPSGGVRPAAFNPAVDQAKGVQAALATSDVAAPGGALSSEAPGREKLHGELKSLNDQEYELAQLEREVELLDGKYRMHVEKLEQARVNDELGQEKITNIKVAQPATLVYKPVSPIKAVVLGLGLSAALFGALGLAFAAESMDQTLRNTDQIETQLGLPVLASLPFRRRQRRRTATKRTASATGAGGIREANCTAADRGYRSLLASVRSGQHSRSTHARAVGVFGCGSSNTRSDVAENLAVQAAEATEERVLLVDADVEHAHVAQHFALNGAPGWRDVLSGRAAVANCLQRSDWANLSILGPGDTQRADAAPSADEPTSGPDSLERLKSEFGLVVVDLPQVSEACGPPSLDWVDEVVLVVEAEQTRVQTAQRARDLLNRAGVRVAGVVLANRRDHIPAWLYQKL